MRWVWKKRWSHSGQATDNNITRRMRLACWVTKGTHIHAEYLILLAFPQQELLRERGSMLNNTYIACLVKIWVHPSRLSAFGVWCCDHSRCKTKVLGSAELCHRTHALCDQCPIHGSFNLPVYFALYSYESHAAALWASCHGNLFVHPSAGCSHCVISFTSGCLKFFTLLCWSSFFLLKCYLLFFFF
jgi:hypothetical protein